MMLPMGSEIFEVIKLSSKSSYDVHLKKEWSLKQNYEITTYRKDKRSTENFGSKTSQRNSKMDLKYSPLNGILPMSLP